MDDVGGQWWEEEQKNKDEEKRDPVNIEEQIARDFAAKRHGGRINEITVGVTGTVEEIANLRQYVVVASICGTLFGLTVLAIAIGASASVGQQMTDDLRDEVCDKIEKYAETKTLEGTELSKIPDVIDINRCRSGRRKHYTSRSFDCAFDFLSCSAPCPLGFKMELECVVSCDCATEGVTQMDVQFNEDTLPALVDQMDYETRADFTVFTESSGIQLWNDVIVDGRIKIPFEMAPLLVEESGRLATIREAFAEFQKHTCIDFVPRKIEEDYLYIQNGNGDCSASYAKQPGRNTLNIASCYSPSHLLHVLMHVLGFHHEHTRDDRDAYIAVVWENVDTAFENAFNKLNPEKYLAPGISFDKNSVMMLNGYAFSKTKDEKVDPTMLDLDTNDAVTGGSLVFTEKDLERIATVYCDGAPENALAGEVQRAMRSSGPEGLDGFAHTWTVWTSWSRCYKTCGYSVMTRRRSCKLYGWFSFGCEGRSMGVMSCIVKPCPELTGTWGEWGAWGECSKTCGNGLKIQNRECSTSGKCKGKGLHSRAQTCNNDKCPNDEPYFSHWSHWGPCAETCGSSHRIKRRECLNLDGTRSKYCRGENMDKDGFEVEHDVCIGPSCQTKPSPDGGWNPLILMKNSDESVPSKDFSRLERYKAFERTPTVIDTALCDPLPTFHWFTGDFNGDGRTDTVCGEHGDLKVFLTNPDGSLTMSWNGRLNCNMENTFIGDFNGDGADDIFCKDELLARNLIYTSTQGGAFPNYLDAGPFCMGVLDKIQVSDIDGDGRSDLICIHPDTKEDTDIYLSALTRNAK